MGAVADHLHASLSDKHYLLKYYDSIQVADVEKRPVPYKMQMRNLNTLRNNAKHQGMFPDPKTYAHFPTTVCELLSHLCKTYLGIDFSSVSLKSLIRNKEVLEYIERAEAMLLKDEIEQGLILLAFAMYHICEASTIPWPWSYQAERQKSLQFTQPYKIEHTVKLLEHGVDAYLYYRFKNLTTRIARHKDSGKLYYWWDKTYGNAANWTPRNATFCLNFCIDTALKFQREEDEGYTLVYYSDAFEDIVEPTNEEATIWSRSLYPSPFWPLDPNEPRKAVKVLKKGE